jgi:hypothetical protein
MLAGAASLGPIGCGTFLDEVSSNEFWKRSWFHPPPPLEVLRSDNDGDHRARALRALTEPKEHGGSDQDQDMIIKILTTAAANERQALCRLAAVETLSHFKDPRAVEGLKEAYYHAGSFNPDEATVLRCMTLRALGEAGNANAVDLLVRVLREPPVEGPDQDKDQKMQERLAAARALGHFKHYQAVEALVAVLKTEQKDMIALRDVAHKSLEDATGKQLPPDAKAWDDLIHRSGPTELAGTPSEGRNTGVLPASGWR